MQRRSRFPDDAVEPKDADGRRRHARPMPGVCFPRSNRAISAGIAEALITTAFGLFVAIPAVWLYNYFTSRIEFVSMEIDYGGKEFMNFLLVLEARLQQGTSTLRKAVDLATGSGGTAPVRSRGGLR